VVGKINVVACVHQDIVYLFFYLVPCCPVFVYSFTETVTLLFRQLTVMGFNVENESIRASPIDAEMVTSFRDP